MPARRPAPLAAAAAVLAALCAAPASAGSQSSNSSSNCSGGFCTRVESFERGRGGFREGWARVEQRDERRPRRHRDQRPWRDHWHPGHHLGEPHRHLPRRARRERDDD